MQLLARLILVGTAVTTTASAVTPICPNGAPEPCFNLSLVPPPGGYPLIVPPAPTIDEYPQFKLGLRELPTLPLVAEVQLYIAATPSPSEQLLRLRQQGASLLRQIHDEGYQVASEGRTTILSLLARLSSPNSTDAEDHYRAARQKVGEYLIVMADIKRITLGINIGGKDYDPSVAQVRIVQGHIDAVNVDLNPLYTQYSSTATVHIEDPNPPHTPNCHTTTINKTRTFKTTVAAGFDANGNPVKRSGWDVEQVPTTATVCD